ncbi:hypothetical protein HZA42_03825 [Candidatus Peregrinibacteria bacterium]|nr:hypothetical protein [Candidatus Peregrinibacteria bacterium]
MIFQKPRASLGVFSLWVVMPRHSVPLSGIRIRMLKQACSDADQDQIHGTIGILMKKMIIQIDKNSINKAVENSSKIEGMSLLRAKKKYICH